MPESERGCNEEEVRRSRRRRHHFTRDSLDIAPQAFDIWKIYQVQTITCVRLMQQFSKHVVRGKGEAMMTTSVAFKSNKCARGKYSKRRQGRQHSSVHLQKTFDILLSFADSQSDTERLTHNSTEKKSRPVKLPLKDVPCHKSLTDLVYTDILSDCTDSNTRSWRTK